jgi:excisionase family DNA binding protein
MNGQPQGGTISVKEAHKFLGRNTISRGALYAAIKRGEVPHLRLGNRILIPLAWITSQLSGK